jgi:hypothetical protein
MEFSPFSHFNWLLELPLGVAVTIESESGLIAVAQIDNGFPLMLGVATPKVAVYVRS